MNEIPISAFLAKLTGMMGVVHHETHKALERAAILVRDEARSEIGHYQDNAGPFVAWAELADSTKADRAAHGFAENDPLRRTGGLANSIGHSVHMDGIASGHAIVGSESQIAVYQELGTSRIPPRSFLGGAAVRKAEQVAKICGAGVVQALVGKDVFNGRLELK